MSSSLSPPRLPLSCWHTRNRREWWQCQELRKRNRPRMETLEMSADPRAWEASHCEAVPVGRVCVGGKWQVWQVLWTSAETLQDQVELTWYGKAMARATLTSHKYPFMQNGSKLHKIRVQPQLHHFYYCQDSPWHCIGSRAEASYILFLLPTADQEDLKFHSMFHLCPVLMGVLMGGVHRQEKKAPEIRLTSI